MMKAKISRGEGFRGVLDYGFGDGKEPEIVGGNMSGTDPRTLSAEFGIVREMRPSCKRPVWHCSLSCPEGETLTADQWRAVTDDFMSHMGMTQNPFVFVRHSDTDKDHGHIIASRIGVDGELWAGQFEARKAIAATQRIERDHGLTLTSGLVDDEHTAPEQRATESGRRNPSKNEIERSDRTGEAPARLKLQEIVAAALDGEQKTIFAFMDELEAAGVVAVPNAARTGRMNGFSFEIDGVPFKGSQLGKGYSWKQLQERGIDYEQERDGLELVERADEIKRQIAAIDRGNPAPTGAEAGQTGDGLEHDQPAVRRELGGDGTDVADSDRGRTQGDGVAIDHAPAGEEIPHHGADDSDVVGGADIDDVSDRIADLAAPSDPVLVEGVADTALTAAQRAKGHAWDKQSAALEAKEYRLTLTGRQDHLKTYNLGKGRGPSGGEQFYNAAQVRGLIPFLSRENLLGYDIYITPIDMTQHFILIDDTTLEQVEEMRGEGFSPALVQQSSVGNVQAILRVPRDDQPQEQKAANALMVRLNQRWGDAKISGVRHPFRMAGFANKKEGRENVFTRVLDAAGVMCGKAADMLAIGRDKLREALKRPSEGVLDPVGGVGAIPAPAGPADARFKALRDRQAALVARKGWEHNESAIDYRVAKEMAKENYSTAEIAGAMERMSPDIAERHPDLSTYILRTIEAVGRPSGRPDAIQDGPEGPN